MSPFLRRSLYVWGTFPTFFTVLRIFKYSVPKRENQTKTLKRLFNMINTNNYVYTWLLIIDTRICMDRILFLWRRMRNAPPKPKCLSTRWDYTHLSRLLFDHKSWYIGSRGRKGKYYLSVFTYTRVCTCMCVFVCSRLCIRVRC